MERSRLIYREQELFIHTHRNKKKMRDTIYIYWPPGGVKEGIANTHTHTQTHGDARAHADAHKRTRGQTDGAVRRQVISLPFNLVLNAERHVTYALHVP